MTDHHPTTRPPVAAPPVARAVRATATYERASTVRVLGEARRARTGSGTQLREAAAWQIVAFGRFSSLPAGAVLASDPVAARDLVLRRRTVAGAAVVGATLDDALLVGLELRDASRRVPVLLVTPAPPDARLRARGWFHARPDDNDAVDAFCARSIRRAADIASAVDAFSGVHGLTGAESDMLFRAATGVRAIDLAAAQGVGAETKKERLANIRAKVGLADLDDVVDAALGRWF